MTEGEVLGDHAAEAHAEHAGVVPAERVHQARGVSVTEALLCGVEPKVHACADATGLSVGAATNALAALAEFGLLESDQARGPRSGRRLDDSDALLDAYQAAVATARSKASITVGIAPGSDLVPEVARSGKAWDDNDTAWAATGPVAAAVIAPLMSTCK